MRLAKRDLVPTEVNLRAAYQSFVELEQACAGWCGQVNARPHRATGRAPAELLAAERTRLHRLPDGPFATVFGQTRKVTWDSTISVGGVRYSVPCGLIDERVWVRTVGEDVVVTTSASRGRPRSPGMPARPRAARNCRTSTTRPARRARWNANPGPPCRGGRVPGLGEGAGQWLLEAAAAGTSRVRAKMAEAVTLAKLHEVSAVDQALGTVALAGRFDDGDLAAILDHQRHRAGGPARRATEAHSLQPGTAAWAQLGGEPGSQR